MYGFGAGIEEEHDIETVFQLESFQAHASSVVGMLEAALKLMVGNDLETLSETLEELGARHVGYGVLPAHYAILETALLRTLEQGLGDLTSEVRKSWAAVLKFVAKAMMSGADAEIEISKEAQKE